MSHRHIRRSFGYGERPIPGAYIKDINGKFWSPEDWNGSVIPNSVCYLHDPEHPYDVEISLEEYEKYLNSYGTVKPVYDYVDSTVPRFDMKYDSSQGKYVYYIPANDIKSCKSGYYNSSGWANYFLEKYISSGYSITTSNSGCFGYIYNYRFPNGTSGWWYSQAELFHLWKHRDELNIALEACGGTKFMWQTLDNTDYGYNGEYMSSTPDYSSGGSNWMSYNFGVNFYNRGADWELDNPTRPWDTGYFVLNSDGSWLYGSSPIVSWGSTYNKVRAYRSSQFYKI